MQIADAFAGEKFVRQFPRLDDEQAKSSEEFRIPIQERIEHIDNDVPKRTSIIDRRLPALRAMRPDQFSAAVFAMGERQRFSIFSAAEPASARAALNCGNRGIAQNNFCRLIGHRARLQKQN